MTNNTIQHIQVLGDNLVYFIVWDAKTIIVDPAEAKGVDTYLSEKNLSPEAVLITHHHSDHTAGNTVLKAKYNLPIYGANDTRIPELSNPLRDGDNFTVGPFSFSVIAVPGHTSDHIAYYCKELLALFCGDTLFGCGCGRLFEGSPAQMYQSLERLKMLPDDTLVYCGHDYTIENLEFAQSIDLYNNTLGARLRKTRTAIQQGECPVPSTIGEEKMTNPFLRCADPAIRTELKMSDASDVEVFAEIRRRKDQY